MDKDDARRLSPAAQHERRRQVIRVRKVAWPCWFPDVEAVVGRGSSETGEPGEPERV